MQHFKQLFFVMCLFLLSTSVMAQSKEDIQRAAEIFRQAEVQYEIQSYQKALELYKEAYVLSEAPEILFNMGQCYRLLGQTEEARRAYNTFLRNLSADDPLRKDVERLLGSLPEKPGTPSKTNVPTNTLSNIPLFAPPPRVFDLPTKELARTFVASELLLGSFVVLGIGSLAFKSRVQNQGDVPESLRGAGFAVSLAADLCWIGSGVAFVGSYRKKNRQLLQSHQGNVSAQGAP
jgi:tetratricopeptide (TPR) repeat protein